MEKKSNLPRSPLHFTVRIPLNSHATRDDTTIYLKKAEKKFFFFFFVSVDDGLICEKAVTSLISVFLINAIQETYVFIFIEL